MLKNFTKRKPLHFTLAICLVFLMAFTGFGQTTVNHSFSSTSGTIDANISFTTAQNQGTNDPYSNGSELRLYYHSGGDGCSITLTPSNGAIITDVVMEATSTSYTPTVKYNEDGGVDITASLSSTIYTATGLSASSSLKLRNANTENKQLRLSKITVTYTMPSTCTEPTVQATSASFSSITDNAMDLSWTPGNGTGGRIVVIKEASSVSGSPTSGTSYGANSTFGTGDEIATGEYVVYNGIGSTVSVTGLACGKTYYARVFEYNTTGDCYNITSAPAANASTTLTATPTLPTYTQSCGTTVFAAIPNTGTESTYWQTTALGTSTADPANTAKTVTSNATIFLRTLSSSGCWSDALTVNPVVILAPTISTQPTDQSEVVGQNATFSVSASDASSYQWQVSTDNGSSWTNISGETTATITLTGVTLGMDGNQYRVNVIGNAPCSDVSSNGAVLNVISGPCHEEDMSSIGSSSSYDDRNWLGAGGTWTATAAREDQTINGKAITIRNGTVTSPTFTDGIASITMTTQLKFSGSSGDLTVNVNGTPVGTIPYSSTVQTNTIAGINVSGSVDITITNSNSNRVAIDDINWTCFSATPEPEIDILGNSISIVNGDPTPSLIDHTDFGSTAVVGGTIPRTFTIENTGTADLNLTGTAPTYIAITGTHASDFTVTSNPSTPITPASSTTFTITFDPSGLGLRTASLSIANNDADEKPYVFAIQGKGVNSDNSDIIATTGFTYTSNIDYTLFQGNPVSTTSNGVASFGFTIRDGAGSNDADALGTELTAISFTTTNIANVRSAALFEGGTFIANASSISGGEISFTSLSGSNVTAPDNGIKELVLYVSFLNTVTDNDQLQYTISSASADASGSVFSSPNAGGVSSSISGDRNRLEVVATTLAFNQQPTTTSINGAMTPSPQVAAVDANANIDFDYVGNITIASDGTMTGNPISVTSTSGVATFNSVVHTVAGTGYVLTASSGALINKVSTSFDITTIVYINGDYRTTGSGTWVSNNAAPAIWERYTSGTWSTSNSPSFNTSNNVYIRNGHTISSGGSFGNNVNLFIQNNGMFVVEHPSTASSIYVYEGGGLTANRNLTINGTLDVENNGWVTLNTAYSNPSTSIWKGTENFRPESILYITDWDDDKPLYNDDVSSNTHNGYTAAFGNVYIDLTGGAGSIEGHWNLLGSSTGIVNLTHGNFEFDSPYGYDIRFYGTTGKTVNPTIHGDLKINSGWSSARTVALGTAGGINLTVDGNVEIDSPGNFAVRQANSASSPVSLTINGDLLINGPNVTSNTDFYMNYNIYSSPVAAKATVNLRGDLIVSSNASIINRGPYEDAFFNFDGTTTQQIDVASVVTDSDKGIPFFVKDGAYVQLSNNNLVLNNGSTLEAEAGGTVDFSWTGTTPLFISDGGTNTSAFHSYPSSILKITSLQGIVSSGATGNVRTTTRIFDDLGDFHYIGLNNQNTGSALPSSIRNLYINNSGETGSNYVTLSTGMKEVHNTLTMTQGHVVSTPSSLLSLGASVSELGTLDYTSGYVLGVMRRWFNSTNAGDATGLFPMGFDELGLKNRHAKVEFNNAPSAGGYLDVTFIYTPMGVAGLPIPMANTGGANFDVTTAEDQGYWRMDNQSTKLEGGNYTLTLTGEGFEVITDLSKLTVLKRVGTGNWFAPGTHIAPTGTIAMPIISRAGITGWSNFGFGGDYDMNPLPIELTAFEVACVGNGQQIEINWTTASETNSSHYIIEKSRDGINWSEVAEVNAAGNSTSIIDYQEIDLNPWDDVSYYRLKQFDFDGNMSAFGPISTSCVIGESEAKVYPNPSTGEFTVEIDWNESAVNTKLQIIDLTGKVVHVQEINLKEGVKQIHFNQMNLQSGVYFVVLQQTQLKPLSLVISK